MDCNIRNVPNALVHRMKQDALDQQISLRVWVLNVWRAQFPGEMLEGKREREVQKVVSKKVVVGKDQEKQTIKRLTTEQYLSLPNSEKMKAQREGKAPGK